MYYLRSIKLCRLLLRLQRCLKDGQLVDSLGEFHGFPQKLGQHLALYEGEASQELQTLCHKGTSEFIDISGILTAMDISPLAAPRNISQASIGQVFKVLTGEYGDIAVKLKYPHVEQQIRSDMKVLRALLHILKPFLAGGNYLLDTLAFLSGKLLEECDYGAEVRTQNKVFQVFAANPQIHVPKTITGLCNGEMIVSQWINGLFLHEAFAGASTDRKWEIYDLLWNFQFRLFRRLGLIHADPHPGNFLVTGRNQGPELTVLDFGSSMAFSDRQRQGLAAILLRDCDLGGLIDHLRALGFGDEVLEAYQPILGDIITVMFEPFYTDENYDFRDWRLTYKINTLLSSAVYARPFTVPPALLGFLRMVQGLYYYARRYRIPYNWQRNIAKLAIESGGSL